jgi:hypothetical protein
MQQLRYFPRTEFLRRKKEIIRDEVYRLVETITTKYNEEVGDIGEIDPTTKVGLGRDFNAYITLHVSRNRYRVDAADCAGPSIQLLYFLDLSLYIL